MKTITIFCMVLLSVCRLSFAQHTNVTDSLYHILESNLSSVERIETNNELAFMLIRQGKLAQADSLFQQSLQLAQTAGNAESEIVIARGFGMIEVRKGNYVKALTHHENSLTIAQQLNRLEEVAKSYKQIGVIYFTQGEYDEALNYFQQALQTSETLGDKAGIANNLNNIGLIYHNLKDYDQSLAYYKKTLEVDKELEDPRGISYTLNNVAIVYEKQDKLKEAIAYYEKSLKIKRELDDVQGVATTMGNLGLVYEKQKAYEEAEAYYLQALALKKEIGDKFKLTHTLNALGELYYKQNQFEKGRKYSKESLKLAQEIDAQYRVNIAAESLMELEEKAGNPAKAYEYAKIYMQTKDSLFNEEKSKEIGRLEAKYNFDKQAQALKLAQAQKEFELNQKIQQQTFMLYGVALILFFSVVIAVLYYRYNKRLRQLNATKDKLFAIVAHDLKNPLSAFRSITQSLSENLTAISKEEIQYFLDKINTSSTQLYGLLQNLLQWAISQTGEFQFNPRAVRVYDITGEVLEQLQASAAIKNLTLENNIEESTVVFADPKMTQLALRNLVSNAIKFTPKEGGIQLNATSNGEQIAIEVRDNGMGIAKADQVKLFNIEEDNSKIGASAEKGTGLGLILCKELVEKQGGKIWVESEEGKGSSFFFTLPKSNR